MKHTLFILALITATIQTFAQSPRIKLNQITKDSVSGSVLISSPTDSGMVYSRDLFISYGADTFLILGADTIVLQSDLIAEIGDSLLNYVSRTELSDSTSNIRTDIPLIIADSLLNYVNISGTQTITGAKTFSTDVEIDGKLNISDANSNVLTGDGSGESISTGNNNTALGYDAGRYIDGGGNNTDSDNSVFIGYDSRPLADAQINQIVIGSEAIGLGSNSVVLGNGSITKTRLQGNVGIGTDSPSADLDVVGDVEVNGNLTVTGTINDEPTNKQLSLGEGYADNIREFYYDNSITVHPSNLGYSYAELIKEDLLKEASVIVTPTATSIGKLYTQKPLGSSDAFDFVRDSVATRVNSLGLIETVADSVPRIDYTDGEPSLLIEPSRTNLLTYSSDLTNPAWGTTAVLQTSQSVTAPDGSGTVTKVAAESVSDLHIIYQTIALTQGNEVTQTYFVKDAGLGFVQFYTAGGALNYTNYLNLNLSTGVVETTNFTNYSVVDFGDGWYKVSITKTTNGTGSGLIGVCLINNASAVRREVWTGNDVDGVYIWGAQLEEGSYPTSYIPTNGSTVTRAADDVELTGAADLIGDSEGTLFFEASVFDNTEANTLRISDGTTANRVEFNFLSSSQFRLRVDVGSSVQVSTSTGTTTSNQTYKIAIKYANNDFAVWVDGIELITDSSGATFADGVLNKIAFEGPSFYGNVKQLTVFPTALTDSELEALTQQ